jgi:hypothetical protein
MYVHRYAKVMDGWNEMIHLISYVTIVDLRFVGDFELRAGLGTFYDFREARKI